MKTFNALDTKALKEIIETSGVEFKQNAVSWIFRCPRCMKSSKLYIRKRDGRYVCWVCSENQGYHGYRVDLPLSELLGGKRREYAQILWGGDNDVLSNHIDLELIDHFGEFEDDEDDFMGEPPLELRPWDLFEHYTIDHRKAEPGAAYLLKRGLDLDIARALDIRYSARQNRVCFPMIIDGKQYGWQGRYCGDNKHIHKADTCLAEHVAGRYVMFGDTVTKFGRAILVEGPMDALKLAYCGGAVAGLGKGVTRYQVQWLAERCKKLYIGLDADAGAEMNKMIDFAQTLGMETFLIQPPKHRKDFGDCTMEEAQWSFERAIPINRTQLIMSLGDELISPLNFD